MKLRWIWVHIDHKRPFYLSTLSFKPWVFFIKIHKRKYGKTKRKQQFNDDTEKYRSIEFFEREKNRDEQKGGTRLEGELEDNEKEKIK